MGPFQTEFNPPAFSRPGIEAGGKILRDNPGLKCLKQDYTQQSHQMQLDNCLGFRSDMWNPKALQTFTDQDHSDPDEGEATESSELAETFEIILCSSSTSQGPHPEVSVVMHPTPPAVSWKLEELETVSHSEDDSECYYENSSHKENILHCIKLFLFPALT
ncbi:hypothetical protein HGM15179_015839 [Zosterops borbonicus]|uniref:Uncharacterized protein n=1 Tax=Zosterops borbonicus TaxID=364589 RepID=A0A8K1LEW4_9PASS|nr:hypothetical protein HGM15179_015839 [Zosterops borbonicus]